LNGAYFEHEEMQSLNEGKHKLKALKISAFAIFSVVIVEVCIGLFVNSLAIISDGLHALLDAFTCVMLFFAVKAATKPPDEEHTYGHEKFEAIGGLIGGLILIGVAILIFYEAATRLLVNTQLAEGFQLTGFVAIGYALIVSIVRISIFRSNHTESQSMRAGFYDAIADLGSTTIALAGFALATMGFAVGDAFASIFLGIMLTYLSIKLVKSSILELSDATSKEFVAKTKKIILDCEGVVKTEKVKFRKAGSKVFIEASVQVPNAMGLEDAHSLASKIEGCLRKEFGNVDATIHVEPSNREEKIENLVKKLATIDSIREVHDVSVKYVDGKLFITLHVYVDPELSVEEAHKIAERIESQIRVKIKQIENVMVHVEPSGSAVSVGEFNEIQLRKFVSDVVNGVKADLEVKRVLTYVAEGKRYINVDCCFTKHVRIKEAHQVASLVEKETKERFTNAVVTVHIEPQN